MRPFIIYLLILLSVAFCLTSFSQEHYGKELLSYEEALRVSKETDQKILLYFGAEWCGYCRKMGKSFSDDLVSKKLDEYLFVKIDIDRNPEIKNKFGVKTIPDSIILNSKEDVIKRTKGYKDSKDLLSWLK